MNSLKEHVFLLLGGALVCVTILCLLEFLFRIGSSLEARLGAVWFTMVLVASYAAGWLFFRKLDERVRRNARPHMIHYHIDDIQKKEPNEEA